MIQVLEGKVAIVTGGAGGIGAAVSKAMAEAGAKVVVNDVGAELDGAGGSSGPADKVVEEIRSQGGAAVANYDTVSSFKGGERIVQSAVDNFGSLDIVVTVQGILRDRMVFNMTEEEWDDVVNVHLKGTFNVVKHACILMRQKRSGRIITFSSGATLQGSSGQVNYGAAKGGVAGLTKVVAQDMGKYGVTANVICPNADTRMTMTEAVKKARDIRKAQGLPELDMEGSLDPSYIPPFLVYLASDKASNVNGQIFLVQGEKISLFSQPTIEYAISKPGRWTVEELFQVIPETLGKRVSKVNTAT
jgi:NAD(P)-dependent dehydrogenase (short-subunit alcohol dehydrogenase family)